MNNICPPFARLILIVVTISALSACDHQYQATPVTSSAPMTSASPPIIAAQVAASSASASQATANPQGLAGFAQIWSNDNRTSVSNTAEDASIYQTDEFKQLRIAMNALDFDRARKNASTTALKAAVEREYQMHLEMLSTELQTAKADQEHDAKEL